MGRFCLLMAGIFRCGTTAIDSSSVSEALTSEAIHAQCCAQRQAKLAMKAKARKQRLAVWTKRDEAEWRRSQNAAAVLIVVIDKREELYGQGDAGGWEYTDEQVAHVDAIVDAYTPEEFAAALAQANALDWEPDHIDEDWFERRVEQRRQQGRPPV